jgi:hypothetical protein
MIRQAHTYLAGAVSSTALVAAAVAAFVLIVSFQALRDWPLAGIGIGGDDSAATGPSNPGGTPVASPGEAGRVVVAGPVANGGAARNRNHDFAGARGNQPPAVDSSPTATTGSPTAEAVPGPAGGHGGTTPSDSSSPIGSTSSSPASGGNGGGSSPSPGGGSGGTTEGGGQKTTSGAITETVNKTVSGVDETTGGVLGSAGVTETTEKVVEGVAGPESTVGKTVDEVVKTVGDLLGGKK